MNTDRPLTLSKLNEYFSDAVSAESYGGQAADTTPTKERFGVRSGKYRVQMNLFRHWLRG